MWRFVLPRVAILNSHAEKLRFLWYPSSKTSLNRHVGFFFALCAIATLPQPVLADVAVLKEPPLFKQPSEKECPSYGCPLLPQDVYYNVVVRETLAAMRAQPKTSVESIEKTSLNSCGTDSTATLTLIGYKGGDPNNQINQDRALVVSPYRIGGTRRQQQSEKETSDGTACRLLGVFDGHAKLGEGVSQYVVEELPKLLAQKLESIYNSSPSSNQQDQHENATKQALNDTFVELDKTAPAQLSGGCTASVILQLDRKVYIANAGDSVSFVAVHHKQSNTTRIVYMSREDKPILPEERARVERMGGTVYDPERGTSRVLYTDQMTGYQSGLAMSRSIGDWEAGKVGVIPNPLVDVIDIPNVVEASLGDNDNMCVVVDENGDMNMEPCHQGKLDDVCIFAVSATDGMMDFLNAQTIASTLATSLFHENGAHVLSACEMLISAAATGWQRAKQGRYRDDIAIAVSTLRIPPTSTETKQRSKL